MCILTSLAGWRVTIYKQGGSVTGVGMVFLALRDFLQGQQSIVGILKCELAPFALGKGRLL
jgi:hypothetical protein